MFCNSYVISGAVSGTLGNIVVFAGVASGVTVGVMLATGVGAGATVACCTRRRGGRFSVGSLL